MADRLEALHQRIEAMTDDDGDFAVVCPLSGKRPVPVRGASFPSPDAAEEAAELVVEYRGLLREVDPHLENIPVVACERAADPLTLEERGGRRSSRTVVLSAGESGGRSESDADGEWMELRDPPVVDVRRDGEPLDDRSVSRQLRSKL